MIFNLLNESSYSIKKAIKYLESNKLVGLKTETVYGVACDPSNIYSIKKLYELKKRPLYNPLIIHVNNISLAKKISYIGKDSKLIIDKFWPGPLTLILRKKKTNLIHDFATSGLNSVAIRMPQSRVMQKIISGLRKPIAAPSANQSGYVSSTDANHVIDSFGNKIDLVIDSGRSDFGLESTIIDMTSRPYQIKRLGIVDKKMISDKTQLEISFNNSNGEKNVKQPNSPGQLNKHYAPHTPLRINIVKPDSDDAFLNYGTNIITKHQPTLNLSKSSNLSEAAYNLFDFLRKLDKLKKKRIVVAPIPNIGIGKTINERLARASF